MRHRPLLAGGRRSETGCTGRGRVIIMRWADDDKHLVTEALSSISLERP